MSGKEIGVFFHGDHWFGHWSLGVFILIILVLLIVMVLRSYVRRSSKR